jgi:hypothetical protein
MINSMFCFDHILREFLILKADDCWVQVAHTCKPSYLGGWGWQFQATSGKYFIRPPISKITTAKWTGSVVQAVGCLLCKPEALSSNPRPTKKEKKKLTMLYWPFWLFTLIHVPTSDCTFFFSYIKHNHIVKWVISSSHMLWYFLHLIHDLEQMLW